MMMPLVFVAGMSPDVAAAPILQPSVLPDEAYAETYTAVASLNDGSYILAQLLFTNAGMGDGKAACRGLWVPPGKEGVNASLNVSSGEWAYDAGIDTLTVGTCQLGASRGGLRFQAELSGLTLDLRIEQGPQSIRPPDHRVDLSGSFYSSDLVVPRSSVRATVTTPSASWTESGHVHLDHSRSNALLPKIAGCWMRFRGFVGASPMLAQVRIPANGDGAVGWTWTLSDGEPTPVRDGQIEISNAGSTSPVVTMNHAQGAVRIQAQNQIYRYRPTEAYGALGRLAAPWIGDPTTSTYSAKATNGAGETIHGILEVSEINPGGCQIQ